MPRSRPADRRRAPGDARDPGAILGALGLLIVIAMLVALGIAAVRSPAPTALTAIPAGAGAVADPSGPEPAAASLVDLQNWEWDAGTATLEVTGIVLGVVEHGGACTAIAESAGERIEATAEGRVEQGSTICRVGIADQRLVDGAWDLVLVYANELGEVRSEPLRVAVH